MCCYYTETTAHSRPSSSHCTALLRPRRVSSFTHSARLTYIGDPSLYSGHTFRRAVAAADHKIQVLGRWRSDASLGPRLGTLCTSSCGLSHGSGSRASISSLYSQVGAAKQAYLSAKLSCYENLTYPVNHPFPLRRPRIEKGRTLLVPR